MRKKGIPEVGRGGKNYVQNEKKSHVYSYRGCESFCDRYGVNIFMIFFAFVDNKC